jgi:hypothetical protein
MRFAHGIDTDTACCGVLERTTPVGSSSKEEAMAEIRVQSKRRASWPLIPLAVLIVLLVGWWFLTDSDEESIALETPPATVTEPVATDGPEETATPTSFSVWLERNPAEASLAVDRHHIASGLTALAETLEARVPAGDALQQRVHDLRQRANAIREQDDGELAGDVRDAFQTAGAIIAGLRTTYPDIGDAATDVVQAASAVQRDHPLAEQSEPIREFFLAAGQALARMTDR